MNKDDTNLEQPEEELEEEEEQTVPLEVLKMMEDFIKDLGRNFRINRQRWRGATPEKNPNKLKGAGYTRPVHNEEKAKKRRKMARESRRINRRHR